MIYILFNRMIKNHKKIREIITKQKSIHTIVCIDGRLREFLTINSQKFVKTKQNKNQYTL